MLRSDLLSLKYGDLQRKVGAAWVILHRKLLVLNILQLILHKWWRGSQFHAIWSCNDLLLSESDWIHLIILQSLNRRSKIRRRLYL